MANGNSSKSLKAKMCSSGGACLVSLRLVFSSYSKLLVCVKSSLKVLMRQGWNFIH